MDALYYYLRMLRLLLWALFLLACVLLALVSPTKCNFPNMLLNAPIIMLTAACLVGLLEKLVRWWHGLPPKRWLGHSQWWGTTDAELFAAIRLGKVNRGAAEEVVTRIVAGAVPAMRSTAGFKGYLVLAAADDRIIAMSLFDDKSVAEHSAQALDPWIKENIGPLLASPVETIIGTVILSA